jgi:hypothetical protein
VYTWDGALLLGFRGMICQQSIERECCGSATVGQLRAHDLETQARVGPCRLGLDLGCLEWAFALRAGRGVQCACQCHERWPAI